MYFKKEVGALKYLKKYLKIAPAAHALWRSIEASELAKFHLKRPILDLGCGYGEFAGVFYDSSVEMGVDISGLDLQFAAQSKKYEQLVLADARKMPFVDCQFKTVLSVSVIEHIGETRKVLREVERVLVPGGQFVFTTPCKGFTKFMFYPRIFRALGLSGIAKFYENGINKIFKHVSLFDESEWRTMLTDSGFTVETINKIIPQNLVLFWDILLISALPSQIVKLVRGKRLVVNSRLRNRLAYEFLKKIISSGSGEGSNFLIVARKNSA